MRTLCVDDTSGMEPNVGVKPLLPSPERLHVLLVLILAPFLGASNFQFRTSWDSNNLTVLANMQNFTHSPPDILPSHKHMPEILESWNSNHSLHETSITQGSTPLFWSQRIESLPQQPAVWSVPLSVEKFFLGSAKTLLPVIFSSQWLFYFYNQTEYCCSPWHSSW